MLDSGENFRYTENKNPIGKQEGGNMKKTLHIRLLCLALAAVFALQMTALALPGDGLEAPTAEAATSQTLPEAEAPEQEPPEAEPQQSAPHRCFRRP